MHEGETANQLHSRIKEIINGLHLINYHIENRDIIRYSLKAFPRNNLWTSVVDAYKVSRDLNSIKLDELFCELELHEQANSSQIEKSVALVTSNKIREPKHKKQAESESESDSDSINDEFANLVKKFFKKKFRKNEPTKQTFDKTRPRTEVTCFECNGKGHYKNECPNLKIEKVKSGRKKKALKATWDETSSDESEPEAQNTSFVALMAGTDSETETEPETESEAESSHGSVSVSEGPDKVTLSNHALVLKFVKCLSNKLDKAERRVEMLLKENDDLKKQVNSKPLICPLQEGSSTQVAKLEEENSLLKKQIKDLSGTLEQFTSGSKYLKMMLGSQRAAYNRSGLGFKTKSIKSYMSLFKRNKPTNQAWVPKTCLVNQIEPNLYWIPKSQIHYVNRTYQAYGLGGGTKRLVYPT